MYCVISQHVTTVSTSQDHRYICDCQNSDWALATWQYPSLALSQSVHVLQMPNFTSSKLTFWQTLVTSVILSNIRKINEVWRHLRSDWWIFCEAKESVNEGAKMVRRWIWRIVRIRQEDETGPQGLSGGLLVLSVLNILLQLSEIYKTHTCPGCSTTLKRCFQLTVPLRSWCMTVHI
jgi:hypothetical protein